MSINSLIDVLDQKGIYYQKTNNPHEIILHCSSGEHEDRTPSLYFNIQKNIFQCWACGFKGGINKYLFSIGITTPFNSAKNDITIRAQILSEQINKLITGSTSLVLPDDKEDYFHPYRMLPAEVLHKQQCFTTKQYGLTGYLCFPIFEFGKLKFIEGRLLNHSDTKSKWYRYPKDLNLTHMMYPLDKFKKVGTAILVEGLLDCLYLRYLGYNNTLCIFGTNGFSAIKAEILKNYGVVNIIPLMDGDLAGQKAEERIKLICERSKIHCQLRSLDYNKDPKEYSKQELIHIIGEPIN